MAFRVPSECPLIASLIRYGQLDVVKALLQAGADTRATPINLAHVFEMEALARMGSEPVRVHADCMLIASLISDGLGAGESAC